MFILRTHPRARTTLGLVAAVTLTGLLGACAGSGTTAEPSTSVPDLAGSSWNLTTYANSAGEQTPAQPDAVAPLSFAEDGTLAGSTGCNRFAGTYTQDGPELSIILGPVTLAGCIGPVADQEKAVLEALPMVASVSGAGSDLRLAAANGAGLLTYAPGTATLVDSSWQASGINNGQEAVVSSAETSAVSAAFGEDGTVTGSGGCNTYTAPYTLEGSQGIEIGPVAATRKACPEPVSSTEAQFFAALEAATTYRLEGDTLTLRDAEGATQVIFRAAD